jgi:hypothetical protein
MDADFYMEHHPLEELGDRLDAGALDASDPAIGQEAPGDLFGDFVFPVDSKSFFSLLTHFLSPDCR